METNVRELTRMKRQSGTSHRVSDDFGYEMIETLTLIVDGALTYAPFGPDNTLDAQEGRTMCPALFSQFSAR